MNDFIAIIKERKDIYKLSQESIISEERLIELIENCLIYSPTILDSKNSKIIILLKRKHIEFWQDLVLEELRKTTQKEKWSEVQENIEEIINSYGTILFFEDETILTAKDNKEQVSMWLEQSSAILQFCICCALEIEGLGVNLQHYNPIIDDKVKSIFNISKNWRLIAQMPFGKINQVPIKEKGDNNIRNSIKIYK